MVGWWLLCRSRCGVAGVVVWNLLWFWSSGYDGDCDAVVTVM